MLLPLSIDSFRDNPRAFSNEYNPMSTFKTSQLLESNLSPPSVMLLGFSSNLPWDNGDLLIFGFSRGFLAIMTA